jgi:hypothetical protein
MNVESLKTLSASLGITELEIKGDEMSEHRLNKLAEGLCTNPGLVVLRIEPINSINAQIVFAGLTENKNVCAVVLHDDADGTTTWGLPNFILNNNNKINNLVEKLETREPLERSDIDEIRKRLPAIVRILDERTLDFTGPLDFVHSETKRLGEKDLMMPAHLKWYLAQEAPEKFTFEKAQMQQEYTEIVKPFSVRNQDTWNGRI